MAEVGKINSLKIARKVDFGVYLDGENFGEILMPKRYIPEGKDIDDFVDAFIYHDSEDRIIATTETPLAQVGEIAYLKVVSVKQIGAFMDWGLLKDLFVHHKEQKIQMEEGKSYHVYLYIDEDTGRIAASSKIEKFLKYTEVELTENQEVDLIIYSKTDLGYSAIINKTYMGMLYNTEIFQLLHIGQQIKGFVNKVREDKKIDLYLQKPGFEKIDDMSDVVLDTLKTSGGFLPITDKSPSDEIYNLFGTSKKTFKKAVGALYKKRMIEIADDGIRLRRKLEIKKSGK